MLNIFRLVIIPWALGAIALITNAQTILAQTTQIPFPLEVDLQCLVFNGNGFIPAYSSLEVARANPGRGSDRVVFTLISRSTTYILETVDRQTYLKITPIIGSFLHSDYSSGSPLPVEVDAEELQGVTAWVVVPRDNVISVGDRTYAALEQVPCPPQPPRRY